jgi:hypothetical protein
LPAHLIEGNTKHLMKRLLGIILIVACGGESTAPPTPKELTISSSSLTVVSSGTVQITAQVLDNAGQVMQKSISFTVSPSTIGTVSSSGLFTSLGAVGSAQITASGAGLTNSLTITVTPGAPASIAKISGDGQSGLVATQLTDSLAVKVSDAFGNPTPNISVNWGSVTSQTGSEGIAKTKISLPNTAGTVTTVASVGSITASFTSNARPYAPVSLISLSEISGTKLVAEQVSITLEARDRFLNLVPDALVSFSVTSGGGSVSASSISTNSAGQSSAIWTLGNTVRSNSLRATLGTLTRDFTFNAESRYTISVRYVDEVPDNVKDAVNQAVARWRRVILQDIGGFTLQRPADACFTGQPALNETSRNLMLFVRVRNIDGAKSALANSGVCLVSQGSNLPVMSLITIDSEDIAYMDANGLLSGVILHEMGHAIGFSSTIFSPKSLLGGSSANPFFTGITGRVEFAKRKPGYTGTPVPLENVGGAGTVSSHWRQSVFGDELMVGFVSPGAILPLSTVTIGAMQDLGYVVDLTAADSFGSALRVPSSDLRISLGDDVVGKPVAIPQTSPPLR